MQLVQFIAAAATILGSSLIVIAYRDYCAYIAMGPHGLPDTFWGWYKQLKMSRKARKDTLVPAPYDLASVQKDIGPNCMKSHLSISLNAREGDRPHVPGFTAPQRQTTATATPAMKEKMESFLEDLVQMNSSVLQVGLSVLEGPVPALQLTDGIVPPVYLKVTRGEIAHIHPKDGSTHLVLPLADSKQVIELGWGQRHRLSGTVLGWGYTLMYAPRDDQEFAVWKDVVCAAARYGCANLADLGFPPEKGTI